MEVAFPYVSEDEVLLMSRGRPVCPETGRLIVRKGPWIVRELMSRSVRRWKAFVRETSLRSPLFRLGFPLFVSGAIYGLLAYINWSFLTSAYATQCTGSVPSSGCGSIAYSAAAWAAILAASAVAMIIGLILCRLGLSALRDAPTRSYSS